MAIFEKFLLDDILLTLWTKHHMIMAEHAQTKAETVKKNLGRNYPSAGYRYMLNILWMVLTILILIYGNESIMCERLYILSKKCHSKTSILRAWMPGDCVVIFQVILVLKASWTWIHLLGSGITWIELWYLNIFKIIQQWAIMPTIYIELFLTTLILLFKVVSYSTVQLFGVSFIVWKNYKI